MKKRKELDALVPNGKLKKKSSGGSGGGGNSSSGASHELLRGDDSDSTDTEEFSVLQPQKFGLSKKSGWFSGLCGACVPLCTLTLVTACVVGSGTLVWMQFGMRQEVDILRDHVQKVEETSRGMPGEFHSIHSQINELQKNQTSLKDDVNHISSTIESMAKEIEALKKTAAGLQKSVEEAPQLESLPKDVDSLSKSLASMGSKITDVETNLGLVKTQLNDSDKNKQHNQEELAALKKRLEELALPPKSSVPGDNQGVMAHIDSEITKVEGVISESNSSIWDKLQWAVDDLHQHHEKIAKVEEAVQNLTNRITVLGTSQLTPISAGGLSGNLEHVQALVNDTVVSVIQHYLPDYFPPLVTVDGTVAYPVLSQYIRNLTGLYVALVANAKQLPSSPLLNDTYLDLNITSLVIKLVQQEINSSSLLQQAVIQKLNTSIGNLRKMYYAMRNDSAMVDAKLDYLQQSLDFLRPPSPLPQSQPSVGTKTGVTSSPPAAPPAAPVSASVGEAPSSSQDATTTKASAQTTLPRSTNPSAGAVVATAPQLPQVAPLASSTQPPPPPSSLVLPAAVTAAPLPNSSAPVAVPAGGAAAPAVSVNGTVPATLNVTAPVAVPGSVAAPAVSVNGTSTVVVNGTLVAAGNGTSGHIPKPSVTGGSLSHPELRPEEPVEN